MLELFTAGKNYKVNLHLNNNFAFFPLRKGLFGSLCLRQFNRNHHEQIVDFQTIIVMVFLVMPAYYFDILRSPSLQYY